MILRNFFLVNILALFSLPVGAETLQDRVEKLDKFSLEEAIHQFTTEYGKGSFSDGSYMNVATFDGNEISIRIQSCTKSWDARMMCGGNNELRIFAERVSPNSILIVRGTSDEWGKVPGYLTMIDCRSSLCFSTRGFNWQREDPYFYFSEQKRAEQFATILREWVKRVNPEPASTTGLDKLLDGD